MNNTSPNPFRRNLDYGDFQQRVEKLNKRLKKKRKHTKRMAMFNEALISTAKPDSNNLTDPMEGQITPIPFPPAEYAPNGMLDGIYPQEDRESKPVSPLYYGILETHMADDAPEDAEEPKDKPA
jgi:hypothetical protein